MKTQNKNLVFNKSSVVDLNDDQLQDINGGSISLAIGISIGITISLIMTE
jgi:hypothetical protein